MENKYTQVAGHMFYKIENKEIPAIISQSDGTVLKFLQPPPKGKKELKFYSKIASDSILSAMQKTVKTPELLEIIQEAKTEKTTFNYDVLENLRKLVPVFFGIRVIEGFEYLKLSRIGAKLGNLEKVSTCDVKIGKVFYDPDADEKKVLGQTAGKNYWPVRTEMGYQFQGISLFSETGFVRYEKTKLTNEVTKIEDSRIPIDYFFPESLSSVKLENIVEGILTKLNEIIKFFEHINNCVQFYASSVLIVYDAETCDCDVKMIDFAHVFYEKEFKDENYLFGIKNLYKHISQRVRTTDIS